MQCHIACVCNVLYVCVCEQCMTHCSHTHTYRTLHNHAMWHCTLWMRHAKHDAMQCIACKAGCYSNYLHTHSCFAHTHTHTEHCIRMQCGIACKVGCYWNYSGKIKFCKVMTIIKLLSEILDSQDDTQTTHNNSGKSRCCLTFPVKKNLFFLWDFFFPFANVRFKGSVFQMLIHTLPLNQMLIHTMPLEMPLKCPLKCSYMKSEWVLRVGFTCAFYF